MSHLLSLDSFCILASLFGASNVTMNFSYLLFILQKKGVLI